MHSDLGGAEINSAIAAAGFIGQLNTSDRGKPHWRLAMTMIETASISQEREASASAAFADALKTEMWIEE
jgi:hypothetical protein